MLLAILVLIQHVTCDETFENYTPHDIVVQPTAGESLTFSSLGVARVTEEQILMGTYGGIERKTTFWDCQILNAVSNILSLWLC